MSRETNQQIAQGLFQGIENFSQGYAKRQEEQQIQSIINNPDATPMQKALAISKKNPKLASDIFREEQRQNNLQQLNSSIQNQLGLGTTVPQNASRNATNPSQLMTGGTIPEANQEGEQNQPQVANAPQPMDPIQELERQEQIYRKAADQAGSFGLDAKSREYLSQADALQRKAIAKEKLAHDVVKTTQKYADEVLDGYKSSKTTDAILTQMEALGEKGELSEPMMISSLNALGLPLGILNNPDSEEYEKLSATLTRDVTKYYGGRVPVAEFQNFLKQLPSLMNSVEGRKRITANLKKMLLPKKIEYDVYKQILKENGGKRPLDIKEQVLERMEPMLDKWADEFNRDVNKADPSKVPTGTLTVILPDGITKVYVPKDRISEALAQGGRIE